MSSLNTISLLDDETSVTEITLLPDGRICLFGASREILNLLDKLRLTDTAFKERLAAIRAVTPEPIPAEKIPHE